MPLSHAKARQIALSFPGTTEKIVHGTPSIYLGKTLLAKIGCREPDAVMLPLADFAERDHLLAADPKVFYVTEHFKGYKGVLARLAALDARTFRALLARRAHGLTSARQ